MRKGERVRKLQQQGAKQNPEGVTGGRKVWQKLGNEAVNFASSRGSRRVPTKGYVGEVVKSVTNPMEKFQIKEYVAHGQVVGCQQVGRGWGNGGSDTSPKTEQIVDYEESETDHSRSGSPRT